MAEIRSSKRGTKPSKYDWGQDYEAIPETLRNTMGSRAHEIIYGASNTPAFRRAMVKAFNGGRLTAITQARQLQAEVPRVQPSSATGHARRL